MKCLIYGVMPLPTYSMEPDTLQILNSLTKSIFLLGTHQVCSAMVALQKATSTKSLSLYSISNPLVIVHQ